MSTEFPGFDLSPASPAAATRVRFTLWELFVLTTLVCVSGGLFAWASREEPEIMLFVSLSVVGTIAYFIHLVTRWSLASVIATTALLGMLGFCLLLPVARTGAHGAARRMSCNNNMRNIALALMQYEAAFGTLPPAYIADEQGKPIHSWRVLILPYLEQTSLYKLYRFDEPWDGPNNSRLHDITLRVYACPSERAFTTSTSYVAVVGPETAWPGDKTIRSMDIIDGTSNTLLLAEVENSGIHWMEPRDLDMTRMSPVINGRKEPCICSGHKGGANAAFADGSVRFLRENVPVKTLRAIFTRKGRETVALP